MSDFDLDALLAESLAAKTAAATAKANRKTLSNRKAVASMPRDSVKELQSKVRDYEVQFEWKPVADVVMIHHELCDCGASHEVFRGVYQRQIPRNASWTDRWVPSDAYRNDGLPKEVKRQDVLVHVCPECAKGKGYPL